MMIALVPVAGAQGFEGLQRRVEEIARWEHPDALKAFYERHGYGLAWIDDGRPTPAALVLAEALIRAERIGFVLDGAHRACVVAFLGAAALQDRWPPPTQITLDLQLTDALLHYGTFLLRGRIDPRTLHPLWTLSPRQADLVAVLDQALDARAPEAALDRLKPRLAEYGSLEQALARYHRIAENGGWSPLPPGRSLRPGDDGADVQALRERLAVTGEYTPVPPSRADRFDAALEQAVRLFQQQHGLSVDGIVGTDTRAALNVTVEARIRQITINLERLRWLPENLGRAYLLVNLAGYSLRAVEDGEPVLEMRVIVGKPATPTPVFSTSLTEVVLAPYWNVPPNIAREEILPLERRSPGYLSRHHMVLLPDGRIRQDPGPTNLLGRIKFADNSPYDIGLHDTPERHLFSEPSRAFSHGCIRVEEPLELARFVLRNDSTWTPERMESVIARWKETRIPAPTPVPMYVLYLTAWVDEQGSLHFMPDLYGYDARLERAFFPEPAGLNP